MDYQQFLTKKATSIPAGGFGVEKADMNALLFEWQKDIVRWALRKGKAALFEDCGLGKTVQQLEWSQQVYKKTHRPVLIIAPLAVSKQTKREGRKFGYEVNICRRQDDVRPGINITNYEILEHFDLTAFSGVVLDESSILKQYGGETRNQIINACRETEYRLSCTATPAPNDYMELGNQAEFLGVMSLTEMLATYFVHDGGDTSKWRLKKHAEKEFWEWLTTWAVVLTSPADLGYSAIGYRLPKLNMEYVVLPSSDKVAATLSERRDARRNSLSRRCQKAAQIVGGEPDAQWLIWCDLNDEADELRRVVQGGREVRGTDTAERKELRLAAFSEGYLKRLITKPSIAGFGLNWQNCHNMIFVGLSDSYEMLYQAIRRCYRFGQLEQVNVYIIISEAEGAVKENIERKNRQCQEMIAEMVKHTKDILSAEIKSTVRMTEAYEPTVDMSIPEWLKEGGYEV